MQYFYNIIATHNNSCFHVKNIDYIFLVLNIWYCELKIDVGQDKNDHGMSKL